MSSSGYENPPVQEALCEVRFADDKWDLRWAGQISELVKGVYDGDLREVRSLQAEISGEPGSAPSVATHESLQKLQLWSKNEDRVLALGPGLLSVSVLGDYPGWDKFRPLIHEALDAVSSVTGWQKPIRTGVRYINRISIPDASIAYQDVLKIPLPGGEALPAEPAGFFARFEYVRDEHVKALLTAASLEAIEGEHRAYLLDIDTMSDRAVDGVRDELHSVIDDLRTFERSVFEDLIGKEARRLFDDAE